MNLTEKEKNHLRIRISDSVSRYIQRKRVIKYGFGLVAALVLGLFASQVLDTDTRHVTSMEEVVNSLKHQQVPDQIQLILNKGQSINIAENEATISYSKTGEQVTLGASKSISQSRSKKSELIFNTLIVPYGKRSSITLADGTKVWLNSGSKLVFPAAFNTEKREVYLEGEGIFEVAHDKAHPFIVKAGEQNIEVLGTVFNISNYPDDDDINTVLKSGSIKLSYNQGTQSKSKESITISPGTLASLNKRNRQLETQKVAVEKYFSWKDGIFIFKNDSMASIMKKIARYYNIEIIIRNKELAQTTFSGYLDVKNNVQNVIKTIQETTKFDYTITDAKMIIN